MQVGFFQILLLNKKNFSYSPVFSFLIEINYGDEINTSMEKLKRQESETLLFNCLFIFVLFFCLSAFFRVFVYLLNK